MLLPTDTALTFYATCPKGLEDLLMHELIALGAVQPKSTLGAVYFQGDLSMGYRACLWSRVANRVMLELSSYHESPKILNDLALYTTVAQIPWELHFADQVKFSVDFSGTNQVINNTQFGAVRVKDAIVDRLRAKTGVRPDVDKDHSQLRIHARLNKDKLQVGIDLSGASLHQRGYRQAQGAAPIKENLAAAILMRLNWAQNTPPNPLIDPMCGSGTFLIEAAWMALNRAPGLLREEQTPQIWGFYYWKNHQADLWQKLIQEAKQQIKPMDAQSLCLFGFDAHSKMVSIAHQNSMNAKVGQYIQYKTALMHQLVKPESVQDKSGLILCNPPYGERLGELEELKITYFNIAEIGKQQFAGWQLAVFTGNSDLAREMRLRASRINKFMNGTIACELGLYDLKSPDEAKLRQERTDIKESDLSEGAVMVLNRLKKNHKRLKPWLGQTKTDAFRLYDADLPEYAVAIDVYAGLPHIQEYAAPKNIPEDTTQKRLREVHYAVAHLFEMPPSEIPVKSRFKTKGNTQYEKLDNQCRRLKITEGQAEYWVNLWDYLDTGVFLDHRPLRLKLFDECKQKRFLNLFCYTATATVQAILGGAQETVSVDMSNTYLDWALDNFELNHIRSGRHQLIQADCLKWLQDCRQGFDVIMLDPPSFSNSKKMQGVLDVQRDHVDLINRCMALLRPQGKLYFSTNLRSFKLEPEIFDHFRVTDISRDTLDKDFDRDLRIHYAYLIQAV